MKKIQKENYVHLDIKPENFLYEYNSNDVKIIDFEFSEKEYQVHLKTLFIFLLKRELYIIFVLNYILIIWFI